MKIWFFFGVFEKGIRDGAKNRMVVGDGVGKNSRMNGCKVIVCKNVVNNGA